MKPLRKFFIEDSLEQNRFHCPYNLGESGGPARTVAQLMTLSELPLETVSQNFLNIKLCDSPNWGRDDLREIVASLHPGATKDNVLITTGTSEALLLLFRALNPKSVAMAMPAFQLLYELPMAQKSKIIPLPIRWDEMGAPFLDEDEWIAQIRKHKPACLLVNNPHNPSGLVFAPEFMERLHKEAQRIKCTLIGDEHYRFLSHDANLLGETFSKKNSFVTGSFIKCLGTPGLRIGWCVGPKKILSFMQNEKNYTTHTVNPITEWISYEVLKNLQTPLFAEMKEEWRQNKNILAEFLSHSKNIYGVAPQGGLVTSLGFKHAKNQKQTMEKIQKLRDNGLFVLPLKEMEFGSYEFQKETFYKKRKMSLLNRGVGFRLGLGCRPDEFQKALSILEAHAS